MKGAEGSDKVEIVILTGDIIVILLHNYLNEVVAVNVGVNIRKCVCVRRRKWPVKINYLANFLLLIHLGYMFTIIVDLRVSRSRAVAVFETESSKYSIFSQQPRPAR